MSIGFSYIKKQYCPNMKIVLNDEAVKNDYGFYILNSGIDLSRIEKNNPVIYRHNDRELAIGNIDDVRIEGTQLVGEVAWDTEDKDEFVQRLIGKYERGVMKGFSMGLVIYRMEDSPNGQTLATQSELYEISACTIQSNKSSVTVLNAQGSNIIYTRQGQPMELSMNNGKIDFSTIDKIEMDLKNLAKALGLPDTATQTEIETAATAVKAELTAKTAELTTLKTAQIEAVLTTGETKGFITAANREAFKAMLNSNFEATKQIIDTVEMPESKKTEGVTTTTLKAVLESHAGKAEVKTDEKETYDYLQHHNPTKLTELKAKQPELYAQLAADYRKGVRHKA